MRAMAKLALKMACGPYDRTDAIRYGMIQPEGIDITYEAIEPPPVLVDRMVKNQEFDVAEMFLALHMSLRPLGEFPFVAIPVFPSMVFRHGFIFINTQSGIKTPKDLEGKRVGLPEFRQTAAVWIKGMLQHEYGVDLSTIHWFEGGVNSPRERDLLDVQPEGPFKLNFTPPGKCLNGMLEAGELDAFLGARWPGSFRVNPHIERLFPNYREVEREYYRKTGIFPIMHTMVLKEKLYQENPWVAQSIFNAMQESKEWVARQTRFSGTLRFMVPWLFDDLEEMDSLFGPDPWPYGLDANRRTLEILMDYLVEQGLMPQRHSLESLFAPVGPESGQAH